ncbi:MAG TPA: hypothetical protein VHA75_06690, partial [Rugosimonospora sp.]|nr:hypothetical protein [Rugosimonospora sp.]
PVDLPLTDHPVSINDPFPLLVDAQGTQLDVCLREHSAVIGGAPGSGKTTLLHRIIARLAWCTDTLIWVLDMNGGGLAEPWIRPWARGEAERPVVDWVAGDEAEAAVMVATLAAIAKDRKMSHETIEAKERGGTNILPVSAQLPAIILITDEGGEIAQAAGLLGRLANQGVARIAQIGRAEGTRVVMSVLRGTADLLSKGMRVMAWIRIALAMTEEDEYSHVLGLTPGRATLVHRGSAWLRRIGTDERPILARSADMQRPTIAEVAVASAKYRTDLDRRGQLVAQLLRPRDVFDGRDPADFPDEAATDALRDVAEGRAYAGRWDRMADRLAAMRGERVAPRVTESRPVTPPPADALEAFLGAPVATLVAEPESADEALPDPSARPAREYILDVLRDARPDGLMSGQIGNLIGQRGKPVSRGHRHEVLAELVAAGQIVVRAGVYHLPEDVTP